MKISTQGNSEAQVQVLRRAGRLLSSAGDFHEVLASTIGACLPPLGDFGFFDVIQGDEVIRTVAAHDDPATQALLAPTRWVRQVRDDMNLCALSTGDAALHSDISDAWYRKIAANEQHLELLRQLAFCSMVTVPMRYRGELVGALTLFMGRSRRHHLPQDLEFAAEVAGLAAPVVVSARLVEQHRRSEDALRRSEERLRMAVEAGQVGIWDWDIAHDKVEWSERVYDLHDVPRDQPPGGLETFRSHVHPDDIGRVEASLQEALSGGRPYATEYRVMLPGGGTRWLATQSHIVRDAQGRPVRMVGGCTDVTERMELLAAERAAREAAERARQRLELLAAAGEALSGSLDPDETLRAIGEAIVPAIADWCRIDLLDENGVPQRRLAHHTDPARSAQALARARQLSASPKTRGSMAWVMRTGESHYGHFQSPEAQADDALRTFTGEFGMHAHYIIPLVARGRTIGAMGVLQAESGRDLSAQDRALVLELGRRAALALDNARLYSDADAANRAKDEFLAMLGHELRNPLAPIATALELMDRRHAHAHVDERRIIGRQVAHLSRLIDDLLDVSRITRGKVQLVSEPVDMKAVVANAVELTRPLFDARTNPLHLHVTGKPAVVMGDRVRLAQVLCNLLTNAAKFTPPGGDIQLKLDSRDGHVEVVVEDSGAGIEAELLPRVFGLFVQGQQAIDRRSGGLGLGLAIVRTLVDMHGGDVSAASEGPGRGARFTVRLPASEHAASPAASPAPIGARNTHAGRILIVDDNVDAAETLAGLLRVSGYEVRAAHDSQGAIETVESFKPDAALLDIGLPRVDGYELARMIRARPGSRSLRLAALTGYGRDNDRARAMEAGFDEHLVKPVAIDKLLAFLERGLSSPASP